MALNSQQEAKTYAVIAKELEGFLQVTAVKALQFAKHSAHWLESIFWILLLMGATFLAMSDVNRGYQQYASEETYMSMQVVGLQRLTFDDAIICVGYDPGVLNLTNELLIRYAERSGVGDLVMQANTSAVKLLSSLLKLLTAVSLIEHGRYEDYERKLAILERTIDLQQLRDWLRTQHVDAFDLSKVVGNWLCNAFRVRIDTTYRGRLRSSVIPCAPSRISWLGVVPYTSFAITHALICVDVGGEISLENMFDSVIISVNTDDIFESLSANQSGGYRMYSYVDFSGDPVSTDMTKDYFTFPNSGCSPFEVGVSRFRLLDRSIAQCSRTAKTRLKCYSDCDVSERYATTKFWNCTQYTWRHLLAKNIRPMCFDALTIEEHLESRRLAMDTNVSGPCWTSCFYPCEFREYDKNIGAEECDNDYPGAVTDGVSIELQPGRFRVPTFEEHFTVGISELFSRLGGTCGLWLGVGLLGICHALLFPLKLLIRVLVHRNRSKPTQANIPTAIELN